MEEDLCRRYKSHRMAALSGKGEDGFESRKEKGGEYLMKHIKVLSEVKPMKAEEVAWIQLKDLIGSAAGMSNEQIQWLTAQWDNWLQK